MNIFPPPEQRLFPFQFYADMRHNNPVAYDDRSNMWAAFRYYDIQSILGDYTHFSSAPSPTLQRKRRTVGTTPNLVKSDPPYHRTLRAVVDYAIRFVGSEKFKDKEGEQVKSSTSTSPSDSSNEDDKVSCLI